jgi:hypothetical protein
MSLQLAPLRAFELVLLHPAPLADTDARPTRAKATSTRRAMPTIRAPRVPIGRAGLSARNTPRCVPACAGP